MKGATLEKKETKKHELRKRPESHLPFANLRREMNRLFDEFFHKEESISHWWPELEADIQTKVDITDKDLELIICAELPGVRLEDIDLTVNSNFLTLKGEKLEETEHDQKGKYRLERCYGSFMRQIPLPCEVQKDKVEASFRDGVLRVVLPKTRACIEDDCKVKIRKS